MRNVECHAFREQFVTYAWQTARHGAKYVSPCRLDRLRGVRATKMVRLGTPYCGALPLIHFLIHLSTYLSHHPSLLHSFTPGSKPTFSTNPSHLRLLSPTGLPHAHHFIFSFTFYFFVIPRGRLSCLPISFLLHVKYTLSYRNKIRASVRLALASL